MIALSPAETEEIKTAAEGIQKQWPKAAQVLLEALRHQRIDTSEEFVSTAEAARHFRVTEQTIRNWVDWGWLPGHRVGRGKRQIPASALVNLAAFRTNRQSLGLSGVRLDEAEIVEAVREVRRERRRAATSVGS